MIKKNVIIYWILCIVTGIVDGIAMSKWRELLWSWTGNDPV